MVNFEFEQNDTTKGDNFDKEITKYKLYYTFIYLYHLKAF